MCVAFYLLQDIEAAIHDLPSLTCVHTQAELDILFRTIGHVTEIGHNLPFPIALLLYREQNCLVTSPITAEVLAQLLRTLAYTGPRQ
jgi:hypothetical protein